MVTIEQQIKEALDKIRPFLNRDGGDVEFVRYQDGVVYVKMMGACLDCVHQDSTVKSGVELILIEEVPGVVKVEVEN